MQQLQAAPLGFAKAGILPIFFVSLDVAARFGRGIIINNSKTKDLSYKIWRDDRKAAGNFGKPTFSVTEVMEIHSHFERGHGPDFYQ